MDWGRLLIAFIVGVIAANVRAAYSARRLEARSLIDKAIETASDVTELGIEFWSKENAPDAEDLRNLVAALHTTESYINIVSEQRKIDVLGQIADLRWALSDDGVDNRLPAGKRRCQTIRYRYADLVYEIEKQFWDRDKPNWKTMILMGR